MGIVVPTALLLHLLHDITCPNRAGLDDLCVDAAQMKLFSQGRIDEVHCVQPEAGHEFVAAVMRLSGDFTAIKHLALTLIDSTDAKERIRALGYAQLNVQSHSNRKTRSAREATVTFSWILFRLGHADVAERVL